MKEIKQVFSEFGNSIIEISPNILSGILVLLLFIGIGIVLKKVLKSRLTTKWKDSIVANFIGDISKWIFIILGITIGLHFVGFGGLGSSILAGAGISAIIIGFAFKDIAENFLSGILLAVNRPFKLGDIIEVDKYKGPVKDLNLRVTHIRTADGRDLYIPNSMIVKGVLINYTKDGLIRQEFMIGLDTYDDLLKVRQLILDYFKTQKDVLKKPLPNVIVEEIGDSSIKIKVLFWIDIFKSTVQKDASDTGELTKSKVIREVKDLLLSNGFSLPSTIIEHKMHKENAPLKINVTQK